MKTVRGKDRISLIPGLGTMISQVTPAGYIFSSCTAGLGVIKEKISHTTDLSEEKIDTVYAFSCLLNFVLQKAIQKTEPQDFRWYGGMSAYMQMIEPFDKKLIAQRLFLISVFTGYQF